MPTSENHPFLGRSLDELQQNLFRILEIAPPSSLNLLKRRLREVSLHSPEILAFKYGLRGEDALFQLKQWEQKLGSPEALWVDEWFSPWLVNGPEFQSFSISDRAFAAEERLALDPFDPVARHDAAVTRIWEAIDLEMDRRRVETARSETRRQEVWEKALGYWGMFLDPACDFWERQDLRIRERNDPRLEIFLAGRARRAVVLFPDWALAALWARAQQLKLVDRAERLLSLRNGYRARMVEMAHVPGPEVWAEALPELEARKSVLLSMIQATDAGFTEADLSGRTWPVKDLEDIARKYFQFVERTLPAGQPLRYELLKSLVEALRELLIRFGNQTGNWQAAETFFELIYEYAPSDELKANLSGHMETISSIKLRQAHESSFERIEEIKSQIEGTKIGEFEFPLQELEKLYGEVREELFYLERPKISDLYRYQMDRDGIADATIGLLRQVLAAGGDLEDVFDLGAKAARMAATELAKTKAQSFLNEIKYNT